MKLIFGRTIRFADPAPDYAGKDIPTPDRLVIPLKQHAGPPVHPTVEKGAQVVEGQVIGQPEPDYADSAPIHSPVKGTVTSVVNHPDCRGQLVQTVMIEVEEEPTEVPTEVEPLPKKLKLTELLAKVRDAGVVPSGPNVPPLAKRLLPSAAKDYLYTTDVPLIRPVEAFVLSGLDREPGIHVHRALSVKPHPAMFVGVEAIRRLTGAPKVIFMADKNVKAREWEPLLAEAGNSVIRTDNSSYPNGLVQMQVHKATKREVPLPSGDPREVGVVFARMETVYWAGMAVAYGLPQTAKHVTVVAPSGLRHLIKVPLGTTVRHILTSLNLQPEEGGKIILGGRLTGYAIYDLDTPITKEVDGLVVLDPAQVRRFTPEPCFNCGICVRVCPTHLVPGQLSKMCEFNRFETAEENDLFHCIECGICAYVCPAKRPMVHYFRHAKEELMVRRAGQ